MEKQMQKRLVATVNYVQLSDGLRMFESRGRPDCKDFCAISMCQNVSRETRLIEFELICLDRDTSTEEILEEMERRNLRPALFEELIYCYEYFTRKFGYNKDIVALGSRRAAWPYEFPIAVNSYKTFLLLAGPQYTPDLGKTWRKMCTFLAVVK
jgi:hypothetical protein